MPIRKPPIISEYNAEQKRRKILARAKSLKARRTQKRKLSPKALIDIASRPLRFQGQSYFRVPFGPTIQFKKRNILFTPITPDMNSPPKFSRPTEAGIKVLKATPNALRATGRGVAHFKAGFNRVIDRAGALFPRAHPELPEPITSAKKPSRISSAISGLGRAFSNLFRRGNAGGKVTARDGNIIEVAFPGLNDGQSVALNPTAEGIFPQESPRKRAETFVTETARPKAKSAGGSSDTAAAVKKSGEKTPVPAAETLRPKEPERMAPELIYRNIQGDFLERLPLTTLNAADVVANALDSYSDERTRARASLSPSGTLSDSERVKVELASFFHNSDELIKGPALRATLVNAIVSAQKPSDIESRLRERRGDVLLVNQALRRLRFSLGAERFRNELPTIQAMANFGGENWGTSYRALLQGYSKELGAKK
ncbi:MAG TPA: hypothetical protein VJH23_05630 [archaeon]|nr:hypothetical protein [archaeon]